MRIVTYRAALLETMRDALASNPDAFIIGQGADDHRAIFGTTAGLVAEFGADRVMDTPLAEEGMTGIAIGAALNGMYPIMTHIRSDFTLVAANQIINLAAKYRYMFGGLFEVPMLIRAIIGRSWGQGSQHSQSLQALFAHIPGLRVVMPASSGAVLDTYAKVVSEVRGPVISFEHRLLYDLEYRVDPAESAGPFASRLVRKGAHVTIAATSIMVTEAKRAAVWLAEKAGIECEIVDLHCVSHIDADLLMDSVRRTGRLLVADTSWVGYGVCAEVCRLVCETDPGALKAPVISLGMAPAPCPTAKALEDLYYPTLGTVCHAVAKLVRGREDHGVPMPSERSWTEIYRTFRGPF